MFYSGWKFPTPQHLVMDNGKMETNYFIQKTCSPGISLVHFLSPGTQRETSASTTSLSATALRREAGERIHLKSDVPIHPHSGVFYFEVEVRSIAVPNEIGHNSSSKLTEPELVVGICRKSLPQHTLPGEEAYSIGLFTAQRMVYTNGKTEGEVVRFHTASHQRNSIGVASGGTQEDRRAKGIKVGDTIGCIVNLMDGTLRFTFNGDLLSVVGTLSRRMPRHGYYPAVGLFRLIPRVSLRVVFPPLGISAPIPRPAMSFTSSADLSAAGQHSSLQEARTEAAGYFVFNFDKYSESISEELVRTHHQKTLGDMAAEDDGDGNCTCRDANIIAAICKHLAARGMTKALSAFEREREELHYMTSFQNGRTLPINEETYTVGSMDASEHTTKDSKTNGNGVHSSNNDEQVVGEISSIDYSLHIQRLREDISRGDMISSARRILFTGVISPVTRDKLSAAVPNANALPPDFWGLVFFTQRQDILFLLRVAHVVEVALDTVQKGLYELNSRLQDPREKNGAVRIFSTNNRTGTAEFMELALNFILGPFEEMSTVAKRHQRFSSINARTVEEAAFGMHDGLLGTEESERPCEDIAAHLFLSGDNELLSAPEVPVTLLVRRSVPNILPPKSKYQRRIIQTLSMLVSHQRAVCARVGEQLGHNASYDWLQSWLTLLEDARAQYRARCWCLLLHAIEDFNGALEYRLLLWLRRHEQTLQEAEKGGRMGHDGADTQPRERGSRWLFPSLRSAWRHVHAVAALEPIFNVVTKAFSDKLHRATTSAQLVTVPSKNSTSSVFGKGPKRSLSFQCDFEKDIETELQCDNGVSVDARAEESNVFAPKSATSRERMSHYQDDVRLSFMYLKEIYKAVFA